MKFGYPEQWIEILEKRIVRMHFCDYKKALPGMDGFTDLLCGDVNYGLVAKAIKNVAYDSWMTLELYPNYPKFPELAISKNKYAMDIIFQLWEKA